MLFEASAYDAQQLGDLERIEAEVEDIVVLRYLLSSEQISCHDVEKGW